MFLRSALVAAVVLFLAGPVSAGETAAVSTRVIYPGETIVVGAVSEVPLQRVVTSPIAHLAVEVEGKVAKRTLLPGRLIAMDAVREPYLVEPGAPVQVVLTQGGLTISATAVPLQPGSAGDQIKVRNVDSGAVFNGIVMADGTIRVGAS